MRFFGERSGLSRLILASEGPIPLKGPGHFVRKEPGEGAKNTKFSSLVGQLLTEVGHQPHDAMTNASVSKRPRSAFCCDLRVLRGSKVS